jgi:hypothetical protein
VCEARDGDGDAVGLGLGPGEPSVGEGLALGVGVGDAVPGDRLALGRLVRSGAGVVRWACGWAALGVGDGGCVADPAPAELVVVDAGATST